MCHSSDDISEDEGSPKQRRITVASYIPQSQDQNGNFGAQDSNRHRAKTLAELNVEEVCQWFSSIGLEKCLSFIREAELNGSHIACIDLRTLDILQVSGVEEREKLLSAIYKELHPPNTTTEKLDSLLETFGPNNVEKFTAALVSMTKSKSLPQINSITRNQNSHKFRHKGQNVNIYRNSHLVEITVNALEQIVHLRTPRDTSVGKVMESCLRMLGIKEDKSNFSLKTKEGSSEEISVDQSIANFSGSETKLLELDLYKKEKPSNTPESSESSLVNKLENNLRIKNQEGKEEGKWKIQELNQQVDSLQNVILQVQELHHGLVAFCCELKNMDRQLDTEMLDVLELKRRLNQTQDQLQEKRHSLQRLRDKFSVQPEQSNMRAEVWLLEKMRLNCQVFKDEISLVHLNRHVAHLQTALEETEIKENTARKKPSLAQLVSPNCPVMLVATEERADPGGHYSFTAHCVEGLGLQVIHTGNSNLCCSDRLVEVNGVSVVGSTEEELAALLQRPVSQLIVLRQLALQPFVDSPQSPPSNQPAAMSGCPDGLALQ
ncbi:putative leucine-rich repeat-containing protein DDB_G0290503 isoform X2 [Hoplias malabaricus]